MTNAIASHQRENIFIRVRLHWVNLSTDIKIADLHVVVI